MEKLKFLSFRGFFLFTETGNLAYSQRFSTVEMQIPKNSLKLPTNQQLTTFFKENILVINKPDTRCVFHYESDIYLCIFPTKYFYISVIPLIHKNSQQINIDIDGSLYFLLFIESILRSNLRSLMPDSPIIDFLPIKQIINTVLPFGSPVIHDQYFISQIASKTEISRFLAGYKNLENKLIPSWKTSLVFPSQQFEMQLKESIIGCISKTNRYYKVFGEFVVNAKSAQKYRGILEAMNNNRFAAGGSVGGGSYSSSPTVQIIDQRSNNSAPVQTSTATGPDGQKMIRVLIRDTVRQGFAQGEYDGSLKNSYGLRRVGYNR